MGARRLRLALAPADRPRHRVSARILLLPVVPELRPLRRPRLRVRRREELRRGGFPRPAVPRLRLEHGGEHRPVAPAPAPARAPGPRAALLGAPWPGPHPPAAPHPRPGLSGVWRD